MILLTRSLLGLALAAVLALASRRARWLSSSGAWCAVLIGTLVTAAGWQWAAMLLAFFFSTSVLSRWRRDAKTRATRAMVDKAGARDAWQVAANGGVYALCALGAIISSAPGWPLAGLGALAAATADTWATEIGTAIGGVPRSVVGARRVEPGTSGAITTSGTIGMALGALFVGTVAPLAGFDQRMLVPVSLGGVAGAVVDTLAGALIQERRWCARCRLATERRVHDCGGETAHRQGWAGFDNDAVNLTSCVAGAAVALLCGRST